MVKKALVRLRGGSAELLEENPVKVYIFQKLNDSRSRHKAD